MSQIKQLIRLHLQGHPIKAIARMLGISKNTVKAYLGKLLLVSQQPEQLLQLEDPALDMVFHAGNPAYKDERYTHLKGQLGYFVKELKKTGVTRKVLWEEYIQAYPKGYAYSQFCYHLQQQFLARKASAVLTHQPADNRPAEAAFCRFCWKIDSLH